MALFNYAEIRDLAEEIIAEFGQPAVLRRAAGSGTASRACNIVEVAYSDRERNGTTVRQNDRRFLCGAGASGVIAIPPSSEEDKLVIGGTVELRIVNSEPIRPATTAVVWTLQCRGK
jgi:hypothetical protein